MNVSLDEVKRLKELTGVGLSDAKNALIESDGDFDKALSAMRKKGLTKAEKRGEREAREGLVDSYVHSGRIGVIVEVNCETDFVARTDDFKSLVHDVAMHIAASAPLYISENEIPAKDRDEKQKEFTDKVVSEGKPENIAGQIVDGMLAKHFAEKCLLQQPYIKNPDITVDEYIKEHISKLGENIVVRQMKRIELGAIS